MAKVSRDVIFVIIANQNREIIQPIRERGETECENWLHVASRGYKLTRKHILRGGAPIPYGF